MKTDVSRRRFLGTVGVGAASAGAVSALAGEETQPNATLKIVAVACSLRKDKTTAQSLDICLKAAKAVAPDQIETELIDLGGLKIPAELAAGIPLEPGQADDFPAVAAKLSDPSVGAIIVGTPVYFANMSALCKAFLERCGMFRKKNFALSGKVAGVVAVEAFAVEARNLSSNRSRPRCSVTRCSSSVTGGRPDTLERGSGTTAAMTSHWTNSG